MSELLTPAQVTGHYTRLAVLTGDSVAMEAIDILQADHIALYLERDQYASLCGDQLARIELLTDQLDAYRGNQNVLADFETDMLAQMRALSAGIARLGAVIEDAS